MKTFFFLVAMVLLSSVEAGPFSISSISPSTIPLLGAGVTITGAGFTSRATISCSAKYGVDYTATVVSSTSLICPFGLSSVGSTSNPTSTLYIWDPNDVQSATLVGYNSVTQNSDIPLITNIYVSTQYATNLDYVSRCAVATNIITLIGTNFGIYPSYYDYITLCSPPATGGNFILISSNMITASMIGASSTIGPCNVFLGFLQGGYTTDTSHLIRSCMGSESPLCTDYDCNQPFSNNNSTI